MKSGKHVLIEKPLATTIEDARRIMTVQKRTGRVAAIDFIQRFNPLVGELADMIRKKILGELRRVDVENYAQDEGLPREHWFWNKKISGGILIEHGVHFIDLVNCLTDQKPIQVTSSRFCRNDIQEDQVMANVVYNRGLMATFYNSFSRPGYLEYTSLHLVFDLGQISLEGWIPIKGKLKALVNSETKEFLKKLPGFTILDSLSVHKIRDISRMEGWGEPEILIPASFKERIRSGGIEYEVEEMITAQIEVGKSKQTVYEDCVRLSLQNLISKIENPSNVLRSPLEAGLLSLEIACKADRFGKA
jgi:predicted dehydrogenase